MWTDPITDKPHLLLLFFHVVLSLDLLYPSLKQSQCMWLLMFLSHPRQESTHLPNFLLVPGSWVVPSICSFITFFDIWVPFFSHSIYMSWPPLYSCCSLWLNLMHHPSLSLTCQKYSSPLGIQICPVQHLFVVACCNPYVTIYRVSVQSNLDPSCHV